MTASAAPGVPRRQRRRDPARAHRHRRRGRPARRVPALRRRLVHHRRRDPRRRRHDRPRRRQVDLRRRSAAPDPRSRGHHRVRVLPRQLRLEPRRRRHAQLRRPHRRGRPRLPPDQGRRDPGRGRRHARLPARLDRADRPARRPGRGRREGRATPAPPGSCTSAPPTTCARPSGCSPTPTRTGSPPTGGCWSWRRRPSTCKDPRVTRVAIPYEGTTLPAYFSAAPATDDGPAPVIVLVNGLDSTKEHMYSSGHWAELAARGISCLMLDQPGTGEALRLQGLTARIDTEAWAGAAVDFLEARDDVDARPHRHRRLVARRLLRPPRRRVREALRALRGLGRQPRLGRGAAPPPGARGRAPGPALLGARAVGLGLRPRHRPRGVPRLRRRRPPRGRRRADHRAVPDRPRRRTTGRSRSRTPTAPTSRR